MMRAPRNCSAKKSMSFCASNIGKSEAVITALTPGIDSALSVLIESIRACAWGLVSILP